MTKAGLATKCGIVDLAKKTDTTDLFLSFAKKVSGTQIFSAKSPDSVKILFSSGLNDSRSSFQYWFKYIVIL